jgi:hypothetical protein
MFLPGPTLLKNSVFIFICICVLFKKIRRRSFNDEIKNLVFVVAYLRNHGKYSLYWIDFVRDEIAHSLIE